ncbi:hypothetical protein HYH03_013871 [Edaphochlamys debaryana]|uniref:Exostosin GT47 domain-containing protein n=1 Tax=Edaphochlamys debaryana TaxID=47281 RepID=A0A835XMI4_9CHLO|nr:hypothetical protein HYH03_013871 [Edaphochlamys debaryana]|eukprot:KAG2487592.1 hypothetical protein HYH03_013871 [Edaphochlamys debaryana]
MASMGLLEGRHHPKFMELAVPSSRERNGPLFYFSGRVCGDGSPPRLNASFPPHCSSVRSHVYSGGVRQLVHYHHWNRTGFFIQLRDPKYAEHLRTSRFCFGPMGGGHGQRQIQAVLAGCVPVLISDGVYEAFEPVLDWGRFGVRVAEADIPRLHEILEAISPEEYALKASRLRCAAQHMAFSLTTGALFGESGAFDAFETLLEVLRAKAAHPDVPFERLRQVDPQLDAFLDCRDLDQLDSAAAPEGPGPGAAGAAAGQGSTNGTADVRQGSAGAVQAESGAGSASQGPSRGANAAKGRGRVCSVSPFDEEDPGVEQCRTVVIPTGGFMCAHSPRDLTACLRPWA